MQRKRKNGQSSIYARLVLMFMIFILFFLLSCDDSNALALEPGDVNGDGEVNIRDVTLVMQHILGLHTLAGEQIEAADVNDDGGVDIRDVTRIMQIALGLDDEQVVEEFMLGSEVLFTERLHLVRDKRVGLVTNQSGVNARGESTIELLWEAEDVELVALYGPEHGIDGKAQAGEYVESYIHKDLGIPVYSLYGQTRMPTEEMLEDIDLLIYDVQDIGARTYTYISTLNYCMVAAAEYGVPIIVLDRPNPLGGMIVAGPVLEERFKSFVGIDIMPKAHGMSVGEMAFYFNRNIDAEVTVIPMKGYSREMLFDDLGLIWVQTSPNIPDLEAVYGYMVTGLGENTGVYQADQFRWVGGNGLDAQAYADLLNNADLGGIEFIPENRNEAGGVRLIITDPHQFNPARTGIYALTYAFQLADFNIPKSNETIVMFDLIMGTDKMGQYLEEGLSPLEIEERFAPAIEEFKEVRKEYLLPQYD